ncbi:uncharacterized protein [Physcomitrium patens]|uniref:RING-type E3 ubiquitin transferase n=1 Tax=Physcomitrium patens TaxID=3218 RepID=A0A2K1J965_PHYPA|nr:uncharacterized protein LOC112293148 isoform X2 [Physcomitrium patens]PNR38068.1 hypothetical protein PHYPA_021179 [Physcomitrium patens]|eukprot:XP_024398060.1 uncharacterized protein LOC112293148 isoform X2 [Physcomitrella patens]
MVDVLEAMGFPKQWCELALRSSSGIEPAVELLLQWQADGGAPPAVSESPSTLFSLLPSLRQPVSVAAVSTAPKPVTPAAGLDAVVPDAGGVGQIPSPYSGRRLKVQDEDSEKSRARKHAVEGKANGRRRSQVAVAPAFASGSSSRADQRAAPVELHIRCPGYPTMTGTFSAGSTLKEVRDFVLNELQTQQLRQPVERPSSLVTNRQSRTPRSSANAAFPFPDRASKRTGKTSRYADPTSSATAPLNLTARNLYFLIPFPREVFDTEASMATTLCDANLFPRGILTAQFLIKPNSSTSENVINPHEISEPLGESVHSRHAHVSASQPLRDNDFSQYVEDVTKREQQLKATLDSFSSKQESERETSETLDTGIAAATVLAPIVTPSVEATSTSVACTGEERSLEVDGERVRHRELALQAAAKRMTEAAQMFREGFIPDEGELGGYFSTPSDVPPVSARTGDGETRFAPRDRDSKGKQVADCGPSQPTELRVQNLRNNFVGFRGRASRARLPLPFSSSRPEKLQRIGELSNDISAGGNPTSIFASGNAIDRVVRRGEVQETSPLARWHGGSPGNGSPSISELRIWLEDGSVLRHTFPAYTTLQSVCEFAIPGRFSVAEYGLTLPIPGSQFFEGEALTLTLQEVGLVPRGVVHLQKVGSRGLVTQDRRRARRMMRYLQSDNEPELELEQLWQEFSRHMNTNLSYEELVELEGSIGRVNVGVPESTIANLPTHTVSRSAGDICIVCLSEMVEGEEVMVLPCVHSFHLACIRQWLLQSTCCPTCKHYIS